MNERQGTGGQKPRAAGPELVRFFNRFVLIEGMALATVVLLMVFDVISSEAMIGGVLAVAAAGAVIVTAKMLSIQKRARSGSGPTAGGSTVDRSASTIDPSSGTTTGTGEGYDREGYDPMEKYR